MNIYIICILFAASFLALFAIGELLFHKLKIRSEYTRKFTHISGAFITLLFPVYLTSHWQVLVLSSLFALVLFVTDKFNLLQSVHSVKRITFGGFLFPVAIYISFLAFEYTKDYTYFYLPVLILAICDPAAALVGQAYPWKPIKIGSETKTLAGFLAFFVLAFALSSLWYFFIQPSIGPSCECIEGCHGVKKSSFMVVFAISSLSSVVEFISKKGVDNVSIPSVILLILYMFDLLKI